MTEQTEDTTLKNPFVGTDRLPKFIQYFVRWQQEIAGLDVGLISAIENIKIEMGLLPKNGGKTPAQKRAVYFWQRWLKEFEELVNDMLKLLNDLNMVSDANLRYLDILEEEVDHEIKHLKEVAPEKAKELEPIKEEIAQTKEIVKTQKEKIESIINPKSDPPEQKKVGRLARAVVNTTVRIGTLAQNLYNRMKRNRAAEETNNEDAQNIEDYAHPSFEDLHRFNATRAAFEDGTLEDEEEERPSPNLN